MAALVASRRIDDTGDVPARGEDKSRCTADQILGPKCRFPRHDVILAGGEEIDRHIDLDRSIGTPHCVVLPGSLMLFSR